MYMARGNKRRFTVFVCGHLVPAQARLQVWCTCVQKPSKQTWSSLLHVRMFAKDE